MQNHDGGSFPNVFLEVESVITEELLLTRAAEAAVNRFTGRDVARVVRHFFFAFCFFWA